MMLAQELQQKEHGHMVIKKIIFIIVLLFVAGSVYSQTSIVKYLTVKEKVISKNYSFSAIKAITDTVIYVDSGDVFTKTLSANTSFSFSGTSNYSWITVILTNTASNYLAVFPNVKWPGGVAPVMTPGAKVDIFSFFNKSGVIYGSYQQNYTP